MRFCKPFVRRTGSRGPTLQVEQRTSTSAKRQKGCCSKSSVILTGKALLWSISAGHIRAGDAGAQAPLRQLLCLMLLAARSDLDLTAFRSTQMREHDGTFRGGSCFPFHQFSAAHPAALFHACQSLHRLMQPREQSAAMQDRATSRGTCAVERIWSSNQERPPDSEQDISERSGRLSVVGDGSLLASKTSAAVAVEHTVN